AKLVRVPVSRRRDAWEGAVVDLPAAALGRIKLANVVRFDNPVGDSYKFAGVALAVRLADGKWVASTVDARTHSSRPGWKHTEGEVFEKGNVSKPMALDFD
ncbi:MAG: hypothetical protein ACYS9X_30780, partial [Planctomycetota bacterium]